MPLVVNLFDVRAFNVGLLVVRPVSVPLGVNLFDVCAFNVGPLDVRPVSVPLGVNLFDVRAFNVSPLDVRPVSDPLRRRPLGCRPLECMSVVHLQTKSLTKGGSVWAGSGVSKATPLLVLHLWRFPPLLRRWRAARQSRMNGED